MNTITVSFRAVDKVKFNNVCKGIKKYETRAFSPKYQKVQAGDRLIIKCGQYKISKTIKKVYHFKSINTLLDELPLNQVMPDVKNTGEARHRWYSFPGYKDKIKKFGIVAWELK